MGLSSEALRECAFQRLQQSRLLLQASDVYDASVLSVYASEVAVECAIRAKRKIVSDQINAKHRLEDLAAEASYVSLLKGDALRGCNADVARLTRLWDNLLRYHSTETYLEFLNARAIRLLTDAGNVKVSERAVQVGSRQAVREIALEAFDCATRVVNHGERFWEKT